MKYFLKGAVGLVALGIALPATAADLPARTYTKAPPMLVPIYDWSGFYVGINGGYGSSRACLDALGVVGAPAPAVRDNCGTADGGLIGGQVGYNWQAASWVFGLEAQGDWADLKGTAPSTLIPGVAVTGKIDGLGLFTGRVGYAWNNALLYVKGGAAVASNHYNEFVIGSGAPIAFANDTRWGGVVGAGVEYGFAPNWSIALEYDHMFLGNRDVTFTVPGIPAFAYPVERIGQDIDMGTVRVNYRFGGPVVARY